MKCPICGNALRISKKDSRFALCDECRKKFRIPQKKQSEEPEVKQSSVTEKPPVEQETDIADETQVFSRKEVRAALKKQEAVKKAEAKAADLSSEEDGDEDFHLRYANIPPKAVREKREQEMRSAYDELLSIGKEEREKRKKRGFWSRRQS